MASVTKRQQARNERALEDLIRTTPGNDRCADCGAKNPGWASWSLGIFLCMRCAGLHRKLGTHISKVKSLSLDSWTTEQVDRMKTVGNLASNTKFNPKSTRPDIPADVDEVDAALEKHIRQKYELRTLADGARSAPTTRQNTGSTATGSSHNEDAGGTLPPKPGKRFGFSLRSSSSTLARPRMDRMTPPISPSRSGVEDGDVEVRRSTTPHLYPTGKSNKPSQMFGMKITTIDNNFNSKLNQLREMGFDDPLKNTDILKSNNGNLDKTVESLIRLGEGSKSKAGSRSSMISKNITPAVAAASRLTPGSMFGAGSSPATPVRPASNPWEIRESASPSSTQPNSATTFSPTPAEIPRAQSVPPSTSWNPFLNGQQHTPIEQAPPAGQFSLEQSFGQMSVSAAPTQPEYQQVSAVQQPSTNPWQTAPAVQQSQNMYYTQDQGAAVSSASSNMNNTHNPFLAQASQQPNPALYQQQSYQQQSLSPAPQQQYQPPQQLQQQQQQQVPQQWTANTGNPWAQPQPQPQQQQQQFTQQPLQQQQTSSNPFGTAWQQQQQPSNSVYASPTSMYGPQVDFFATPSPQPQQQQQYFQQQQPLQQPQQLQQPVQQPQQPQFNNQFSQLQAPQPLQPQFQQQQPQQPFPPQQQPQYQYAPRHDKSSILALYSQQAPRPFLQSLPEENSLSTITPSQYTPQQFQPQQRSVSMPVSASATRHVSAESRDFQSGVGGFGANGAVNGRHSPDAFAGLSARFGVR
jgi:hypothetical protein